MNNNLTQQNIPNRILYTMIRVGNLEKSVAFYKNVLGMNELRRENFSGGRFTLVFMGYGEEAQNAVIELTCNWDENSYEIGTGYGHIALQVDNIFAACERLQKMEVKIILKPGPMTYPVDETGHKETIAFIEDPDGYKIELIEHKRL